MEELNMDNLESISGGAGQRIKGKVEIVNCKHGIYVRKAPSSDAARVEFRHLGDKLPYYGFQSGWCKVKSSKGTIGYVKKGVVEVIS